MSAVSVSASASAVLAAALAVCAVPAFAASAAPAAPAAAPSPPPLQLARFQADAGGTKVKDDKKNVNGEYLQVRNTSAKAINVTGYWFRDTHGNRFVFPRGSVIGARTTVTVYTGVGTNRGAAFYWKQGFHKWNNTGDTASLHSPKNVRLDVCTYKKNVAGFVSC